MIKEIGELAQRIFPGGGRNMNAKTAEMINGSSYISRDLSWLQFNYRVLDQARNTERSILERMKFLAITAGNIDEFFMIRVGSLYNYLDFGRERIDYSGLREKPFRVALLNKAHGFFDAQNAVYNDLLKPLFAENEFSIITIDDATDIEKEVVEQYFKKTVYPMLTPMLLDIYHTFPVVNNKTLVFGVVTETQDPKNPKRLSLVQIPQNLPRFFELERGEETAFLPIEEVIRWQMDKLFRNIRIESINLFRITRNADISIDESDDVEANFVEEVRRKLSTRRTGRVVRIEIMDNYSSYMMKILKQRWEIDYENIFVSTGNFLDYAGLWQIVNHPDFKSLIQPQPAPVPPLGQEKGFEREIFEVLKQRDVLMHHPYNDMEPLVNLLEQAAEDPYVLSIKLTIYRLAKNSRIINALLKAAENGKYVSALFEVTARFDEENNIREAKRLQKAGCFVIYGVSTLKTHTKLLLIVRKEEDKVTRYVHMSSGNYNETTSRMYTDVSLLTTNEVYANDVSEFFNVITGHSVPDEYKYLITAPRDMRKQLIDMIRREAAHAKAGKPSGIVIKVNSLEDKACIDELYLASQAGVKIQLIIRGICCLRPGRQGLSENITVYSIVGNFLEHTRLYYFHNNGKEEIYSGSADIMNRSFDRRVESIFLITDELVKQECISILVYNLRDNVNSYIMQEDGGYHKVKPGRHKPFNIHTEFFKVTEETVRKASLVKAEEAEVQ